MRTNTCPILLRRSAVPGDALFHEASRHLARFGHRARLLRRRSEEAWETSGALHGSSVLMDLLGRAKGSQKMVITYHCNHLKAIYMQYVG